MGKSPIPLAFGQKKPKLLKKAFSPFMGDLVIPKSLTSFEIGLTSNNRDGGYCCSPITGLKKEEEKKQEKIEVPESTRKLIHSLLSEITTQTKTDTKTQTQTQTLTESKAKEEEEEEEELELEDCLFAQCSSLKKKKYSKQLLYSAAKHDIQVQQMHACCDDKGSLVISLALQEDIYIGAFTPLGWIKDLQYVKDIHSGGFIYYHKRMYFFSFQMGLVINYPNGFSFGRFKKEFFFDPSQPKACKLQLSHNTGQVPPELLQIVRNWYDMLVSISIYTLIL